MNDMAKTVTLPDNRILAYAEYGDPLGTPVFFFHGIPGSRVFTPPDKVTKKVGVRLICTDRPGFGLSTFYLKRRILDWPEDVRFMANLLGIDKFHVVGHSGGAPYTLACAYALPDRVRGAATVCGVGPADAREALRKMTPINRLGFVMNRFLPWSLWKLIVWYLYRKGHDDPAYLFERGAKDRAPSDTEILKLPGVLEENYASQSEALRQGTDGFALEARLIIAKWGFKLEEIQVPVHVWHGTEDVDTPVGMANVVAARIPGSQLTIFQGEAHMLIYPHWEEILIDLCKSY